MGPSLAEGGIPLGLYWSLVKHNCGGQVVSRETQFVTLDRDTGQPIRIAWVRDRELNFFEPHVERDR